MHIRTYSKKIITLEQDFPIRNTSIDFVDMWFMIKLYLNREREDR